MKAWTRSHWIAPIMKDCLHSHIYMKIIFNSEAQGNDTYLILAFTKFVPYKKKVFQERKSLGMLPSRNEIKTSRSKRAFTGDYRHQTTGGKKKRKEDKSKTKTCSRKHLHRRQN